MAIAGGQVQINGPGLAEPYVRHRRPWDVAEVTLGPREYFVIGDNRGMSVGEHDFGRVRGRPHPRQGRLLMRRTRAIVLTVVALAGGAWFLFAPADPGAPVRTRAARRSPKWSTKAPSTARAPRLRSAQLGVFFTEDVDVELGSGAAPIHGRDTIIGMAGRLQPRTAAFRLKFEDVSVMMAPEGETADVHLTAEFIRRSITTGEESLDAREFIARHAPRRGRVADRQGDGG